MPSFLSLLKAERQKQRGPNPSAKEAPPEAILRLKAEERWEQAMRRLEAEPLSVGQERAGACCRRTDLKRVRGPHPTGAGFAV